MRFAKGLMTTAALLAAAWVFGWTQSAILGGLGSSAGGEVSDATAVVAQMGFRGGRGWGWGGGWGYGNGYYDERSYVVAEKRGTEVMYSTFHYMSQVSDRVGQLQNEKTQSEKFNSDVRRELTTLRSQLGSLKAQLSNVKDAGIRNDIQGKVDVLNQTIYVKEASIRPPLHWVAAGPFLRRAQVDDFILQLQREVGPEHVHAWKAAPSPGAVGTVNPSSGAGY